jgi:hypothetical protein
MARMRINVHRAVSVLARGGRSRQTTLDGTSLEELREALKTGEWKIL